jgi:hypothetical protein
LLDKNSLFALHIISNNTITMADLEKLNDEVTACAEKVKTLKTEGGDKVAIGAAVAALLASKKAYAAANNGIGVDGKPFEEPLTKAQKKAKAKAEKGETAGPEKPVSISSKCSQCTVAVTTL